jgi:hypothetical protein
VESVYSAVRTDSFYTCCSLCFECFVLISEQTAAFAIYVINWLVFITVVESVYSAVRSDSFYTCCSLCAECFVLISVQTAAFAVYIINWLVFITVVENVYSTVRTDSLYKADYVWSLKGYCMSTQNRNASKRQSLVQCLSSVLYIVINKGRSTSVVVRLWAGQLRNRGFDYRQERPPHSDGLWAIHWVEVGNLSVVSRSGLCLFVCYIRSRNQDPSLHCSREAYCTPSFLEVPTVAARDPSSERCNF